MMRKPTAEQSAAVNSNANKIVISASAGSGKTTTMIERISQILKNKSCTLDQLLVLTFTDESAKDMRKKLQSKNLSPVDLQAAAIGTFHSFCANLVRAWFTVAEVSPSFAVMDDLESNKIKNEIFDQIIKENYAATKQAVDMFAATRTLDGLRQVILHVAAFLETRRDPEVWLRDVALRCYDVNIDQNPAVQALLQSYHRQATWYRSRLIDLGHQSPQVTFMMQVIEQLLAAKTYDDFHALTNLEFPTLKPEKDWPLYEDFKALRSQFRDQVIKPLVKQFRFTKTQLQTDVKHDQQTVAQILTLVTKFQTAYAAKKLELKKLDFADLEKYALRVLRHPEAVTNIRQQYKYIFVDEGQDTNPVQFQIIDILRGDDKFFYMVGDVKQSIYGFRGCEPEMFAAMTLQDLVTVLRFNKNFRSTDPILQYVNQVFTGLIQNYTTEHQFVLDHQPDAQAVAAVVKIELADNLNAQMELVYQQISQAQRPLTEIAILCESTTHFETLRKYLEARGIACVIDRTANAFEEPEVALLNHFLFAALNPTNELAKFLSLKYLFGCSNDTLAQVRLGQKTLPEIDAVFQRYHTLARTLTTGEVLTMAATEFGMLEIPAVDAFLEAIRGVADFDTVARYLYLVEHQLVEIQINVGANVTDAVKIMTIHHAKGLEFPMVILFNMGDLWHRKTTRRQIALDKDLGLCVLSVDTENYTKRSPVLQLGLIEQEKQRLWQEKVRLLYVALTRAKAQLYIVGAWKPQDYLLEARCMLDLLQPTTAVVRENVVPSPERKITKTDVKLSPVVLRWRGNRDVLVKQSVTALVNAQESVADYVAPVRYQEPGGKEYGTAFHKQMQYGDLPPVINELVAEYEIYKELPFLYLQGDTIVQGIMDLLAVRDQSAIIVDYKTTRLPEAELVKKYREQLRLYAQALEGYQVQTYIYSTVHQKLIAVL